jgi:heme-degrading monooxygenase HmoA
MAKIGQPYTSGRWLVREGQEDEFITRWTEFTQWALENSRGAEFFALIREEAEPRRFLSFGAWEDKASVDGWRSTPEFQERMRRCRELCEDFVPSDSVLSAAVGM